ncbi:hypothetical protein QWZ08_04705 [Ferruginibacter paludis]|uniref:hypothetical protein n=1 Tax=Ferruginibacter TaxID=1004303 RepID=UPI0025B2C5C7|nr:MULTISPECIES: hypothetical protein [Ferruginibacter]MDB5277606.1 rane protein [Ferruginibacter sp.]MDN3654917.1 hypothetical protein [Ferruginibacter paludis]
MEALAIIIVLTYGALAGWVGKLFKGNNLELNASVLAGIFGGLIGYVVCAATGINSGQDWQGYVLTAAFGAFFLLTLLNMIIPKRI